MFLNGDNKDVNLGDIETMDCDEDVIPGRSGDNGKFALVDPGVK